MTLAKSDKSTLNRNYQWMIGLVFLTLFLCVILLGMGRSASSNPYQLPTFNTNTISSSYASSTLSPPIVRATSSFICDNRTENRFPLSISTPSSNAFDSYRRDVLVKYCDIVPIPQANWKNALTYREEEIAFVIFTGAMFFQTRATVARDTWLSRITNYYILSGTPYPSLPITVVEGAGEDKLSNMKKLFYGLQVIYRQQMNVSEARRQKWFYIAGCDTFVLPHHLLKRLDGLDYRQPVFLGGHWGRYLCFGPNGTRFTAEFPSGGAGFFFSMKLLAMMQPHLTNHYENVWPKTSEISDVALACLVHQLGVPLTKREGFWAHPPALTLQENNRDKFHADAEPNNFHYIKPDEMYALDEFYVHQQLDRLANDRNWSELLALTRRFVSSHYELLRKKRNECTLPKIGNASLG